MDFTPFYHETQVSLGDDFTLHMVIDLPAIDRLERLLKTDISTIATGMTTSVAMMAKVLWGVTREHHDNLDLALITGILLPGPKKEEIAQSVVAALGHLLVTAGIIGPAKSTVAPKKRTGKRGG